METDAVSHTSETVFKTAQLYLSRPMSQVGQIRPSGRAAEDAGSCLTAPFLVPGIAVMRSYLRSRGIRSLSASNATNGCLAIIAKRICARDLEHRPDSLITVKTLEPHFADVH
jgi:hypothetical protein